MRCAACLSQLPARRFSHRWRLSRSSVLRMNRANRELTKPHDLRNDFRSFLSEGSQSEIPSRICLRSVCPRSVSADGSYRYVSLSPQRHEKRGMGSRLNLRRATHGWSRPSCSVSLSRLVGLSDMS